MFYVSGDALYLYFSLFKKYWLQCLACSLPILDCQPFYPPTLSIVDISCTLFDKHTWLALTGLTMTIILTAFTSYHCIERPFLRRSSHYRQAAEETPST